jgi:hypothetical protein
LLLVFFSNQFIVPISSIRRSKEIVAKDAELYGMCLLGDGATIRGMPLMNVLVSTPSASSVLDIIDCTEHLEEGGKKDAKYIASIFEEHIQSLDPMGVHLNAILFDGASNVQKAGRAIEAKYPQVSVLHGVEHVISLFFGDVAKLCFVRFLVINYRRVYRVFGSGAMHAPYAIFRKQAQTFNGGVKIGLIRAADTRMAGYFYAFHRLLRLRAAVEATISSVEFQSLKLVKPVVLKAIAFLKDKDMWNALHCVTRCLFPALRVLRLADRSEPGFDCLNYFIRKTDQSMLWSTRSFETLSYFTNTIRNPDVLQDIMDNHAGEPLEDDDEFADMLEVGHEGDGEDSDDGSDVGGLTAGGNFSNGSTGKDFGEHLITLWNHRRKNLESDFCIAGWFLSPLEEVMMDVKAGRTGQNTAAMDRILDKFYHNCTEEELGKIKDIFWTEFEEFHNKTGRFGFGRKYIWNSELIRQRLSAKWHAQYSMQYTEVSLLCVVSSFLIALLTFCVLFCYCNLQVLGKVACRILSTLLGIGIAERSWGAVKHLKNGCRSLMGSESTRMQATIFGASCIEKARTLKAQKEQAMELWNENDAEFQLGLESFNADEADGIVQQGRNQRRLFHAWREDWEEISSKTNDLVHETRLLRKYACLRWLDPDSNTMFVAERDNMEWRRGLGWCVIAIGEDGETEPWPVKLLPSLIKKTKQDSILNVEFVHLSAAEKASRKAAREAAPNQSSGGRGKKQKKRKRGDSDSSSDSD